MADWLGAAMLTGVSVVIAGIVIQQLTAPNPGAWGPWEILGHVLGIASGLLVAVRMRRRTDKEQP